MHHVLGYQVATGGSVTDKDMTALVDPEISQRNGHYIFTEDYQLLAAYARAATLTRTAFSVPTWNAIGKAYIWPENIGATVASPPQIAWYNEAPPLIPRNEEFQVLVTDGLSETADVILIITPPNWNQNIPRGRLMIPTRFTSTITIVAHAWSALGTIAFEQSLRGGVYSILGCTLQGTNLTAFRLVFPRNRTVAGRRLRPGSIGMNALGDIQDPQLALNPFFFGEWGRFHTFEPPQLEITGVTAGSTVCEGRIWLEYIGEPLSLLDQWIAGGS